MGILWLASCTHDATNSGDKTNTMTFKGAPGEVKIMTLDPGHFHAALVQKFPYKQVDSVVNVYAPEGPELNGHIERIQGFNQRAEEPTNWQSVIHSGPDFLQEMLQEKPGNVVIISGNNAQKTNYIKSSIEAGLNVLADKPMAIKPTDFITLQSLFPLAEENGVLLYDIMTERYEITTILQKELSHIPELFGELQTGSIKNPAITKESVHHFFKYVSGKPLIRPPWFFDVNQQGEGLVDVSTHLVDLVFWECFPEEVIDYRQDIRMLSAERWPTRLSMDQFQKVTGLTGFPDYLHKDIVNDTLVAFTNGEMIFTVNGVHAKVAVTWDYQAPPGAGDTHYSIMRGSKVNLIIRQGAEQKYRPILYVEPMKGASKSTMELALSEALEQIASQYPGLSHQPSEDGWEIVIPDKYRVGHEAHFAQVTEKYLHYLIDGALPAWEVPNMLAKYYVTTEAYRMSR